MFRECGILIIEEFSKSVLIKPIFQGQEFSSKDSVLGLNGKKRPQAN